MRRPLRNMLTTAALAAGLAAVPLGGGYASSRGYVQKNLVSNDTRTVPAAHQDPTLLNPWGIAFFPGGPFWINDNGSGISALYNGDGTGFGGADPALAVTIPPPKGGTPLSAPTGIVANSSFAFALKDSNPALFIFDTEDGTISAWNLGDGLPSSSTPPVAELKVDNSKKHCTNGATGAVYKGLALGTNTAGVFLYATNFRCATIDVFNGNFKPAKLSGNFQDSSIPYGFAPFGIAKSGATWSSPMQNRMPKSMTTWPAGAMGLSISSTQTATRSNASQLVVHSIHHGGSLRLRSTLDSSATIC
jgi:uncharacterized protein (TIGR03118 family)